MWTCNESDPPELGPGLQIRETAQAVGDEACDVNLALRERSHCCSISSRGGRLLWFAEGGGDGAAATQALANAELQVEPGFAERRGCGSMTPARTRHR
jgi:hypothetical protein